MRSFAIRVARKLNRIFGRKGRLWADRYFRRDLYTAREVRAALVYVLQNHKKHRMVEVADMQPDPFSSGLYFDGWEHDDRIDRLVRAGIPYATGVPPGESERVLLSPTRPAKTALLRRLWKSLGLIRFDEVPRSMGG
jgi:hypothetical protein